MDAINVMPPLGASVAIAQIAKVFMERPAF